MAWYRPSGGGELSETVLWTNSSPTSNFSSGSISLSDNISNYDSIGVYYRVSTTNDNQNEVIIKVSDFQSCAGNNYPRFTLGASISGNTFARNIAYADDTSLTISANASRLGYNAASAAGIIPIKVVGLK